ncbi:MAG: type II toxin-antitoxin system prevent-host-death family antitoxin [Sphingomonadales bacterium]|nr:type II toxin-antitoxin system prevent-host-death family antitoxin [Sphingomonadales bacterium]MDE2569622.1 type II toxin-antitoxin system prevent-host-death family antitoxin [Sphingomonadales bacterium]
MHQLASSTEVSRAFARFCRQALQGPITIMHRGKQRLVLLSIAEYERLKERDREVLTLVDFTVEDRAAIAASRAPIDATQFNREVP